MPWLERRVKHFFPCNCVFLCISPRLITVLCRAWVGGWGCAPEAVAERTDEKVEALISLGIALPFVVEWPLIALTTTLRLITAGPHISRCFCWRWWLVWELPHPIILPSLEYISGRLSLLLFFPTFFYHKFSQFEFAWPCKGLIETEHGSEYEVRLLSGCHAATICRSYYCFINGVIAYKEFEDQCALHQEIKFSWLIASFNLPCASTYWTTAIVQFLLFFFMKKGLRS